MFEFAALWAFVLLPLPLLVRLIIPKTEHTQLAALRAPIWSVHQRQVTNQSQSSGRKLILPSVIWLLLIVAAARPQYLGEPITLPAEGRDLMIAVDLSGSMQMEDMEIRGRDVNRLEMTKYVMRDFIERRVGDRLGLILFADTAYLQTPLTRDRNTVQQMLDEAVLGLVGEKTAIGDSIGLAAKRFNLKDDSNRILILLTDGQNTAGNLSPQDALTLAKEQNIKIYTIGVASDKVISQGFFGLSRQRADADLDENLLQALAEQTGGQYFRAKETGHLEQIYKILDQLEPIDDDNLQMRPLTALFFWPLAAAFLLSIFPALMAVLNTVHWPWQKAGSSMPSAPSSLEESRHG